MAKEGRADLVAMRVRRGLTLEQAAAAAGIAGSTLWRVETGQSTMQPATVIRLAKAYDVTRDTIQRAMVASGDREHIWVRRPRRKGRAKGSRARAST